MRHTKHLNIKENLKTQKKTKSSYFLNHNFIFFFLPPDFHNSVPSSVFHASPINFLFRSVPIPLHGLYVNSLLLMYIPASRHELVVHVLGITIIVDDIRVILRMQRCSTFASSRVVQHNVSSAFHLLRRDVSGTPGKIFDFGSGINERPLYLYPFFPTLTLLTFYAVVRRTIVFRPVVAKLHRFGKLAASMPTL